MKKISTFFILLFIQFVCYSQVICDDNACVNTISSKDLFKKNIQNDPEELKAQSQSRKRELREHGAIFDLNCEHPSFWVFTIKDGRTIKKIDEAPSTGVAIDIERESSCDVHKKTLIVPIKYNGHDAYAATGADGVPVYIDDCYVGLLTKEKYWCKGLPVEPTQTHFCKICGREYTLQRFQATIGGVVGSIDTFFCSVKNQCLNGKNHDNWIVDDSIKVCANPGNRF